MENTNASEVIVVGAGLAGLSAARRLSAAYRVLVLEASHCCGGRARSVHSRGLLLEHGCEFIHGAHTITRQLCAQAGLDLYARGEPFLGRW